MYFVNNIKLTQYKILSFSIHNFKFNLDCKLPIFTPGDWPRKKQEVYK